jgi:hypothetical protein
VIAGIARHPPTIPNSQFRKPFVRVGDFSVMYPFRTADQLINTTGALAHQLLAPTRRCLTELSAWRKLSSGVKIGHHKEGP